MDSLKNILCSLTNSGAIFFENCGLWLPIQNVTAAGAGTSGAHDQKPRRVVPPLKLKGEHTTPHTGTELKLLHFIATELYTIVAVRNPLKHRLKD